jgi:uncharacterized OsmC-like protein
MKLSLLSDASIRLEPGPGPMTIVAPSAEQSYSPFHMVAGGLAYCTFSVLHAWAERVELNAEDLIIDVAWSFAENPHRIGAFDVEFTWPSLPEERLAAAKRVAGMCTLHATFHHPPDIRTDGTAGDPSTSATTQADGTSSIETADAFSDVRSTSHSETTEHSEATPTR